MNISCTPKCVHSVINELTFSETLKLWASNNVAAMYKTVAAPVSTILSAFGTVAQGLVQVLYDLRPSIWSSVSELQHKIDVVQRLTDEETLEFIYGRVHKVSQIIFLRISLNNYSCLMDKIFATHSNTRPLLM
jgi:hypothetical protein